MIYSIRSSIDPLGSNNSKLERASSKTQTRPSILPLGRRILATKQPQVNSEFANWMVAKKATAFCHHSNKPWTTRRSCQLTRLKNVKEGLAFPIQPRLSSIMCVTTRPGRPFCGGPQQKSFYI